MCLSESRVDLYSQLLDPVGGAEKRLSGHMQAKPGWLAGKVIKLSFPFKFVFLLELNIWSTDHYYTSIAIQIETRIN